MSPVEPDPWQQTFNVNQDRIIDPMTVQTWCTGCPFKKSLGRSRNASGGTSGGDFASAGVSFGGIGQITYKCISPGFDYKKKLMQEHSTVGFGWCPFFEEKWALKEGEADGEA